VNDNWQLVKKIVGFEYVEDDLARFFTNTIKQFGLSHKILAISGGTRIRSLGGLKGQNGAVSGVFQEYFRGFKGPRSAEMATEGAKI
jgi:hypothetical protein